MKNTEVSPEEAVLKLQDFGNQYRKNGELTKADEFYRTALEIDPENAITLNALGQLAMQIEQYDTAVILFEHAIQYNGENTEYQENLALANEKLNSQV